MTDPISVRTEKSVAFIAISNPPVNAASAALRQGLFDAIESLEANIEIDVIAIYALGRTFVAGADVKEFGKISSAPSLPDLCNRIESCKTPVVTILHGTPLGGGLELAMASHARVGIEGVQVGLPEVKLGIMPGAGGTQRTPRLVGLEMAIDMVTSGRRVTGREALENGLIDRLVAGEPEKIAIEAASQVLSGALKTRRTGETQVELDPKLVLKWKERVKQKTPHLFSPLKCIEGVEASALPIHEGMQQERRLFQACMNSPQRSGLIHAFLAERVVSKIPEAGSKPFDIAKIGVVGGGTMGTGIATAALLSGYTVDLVDPNTEARTKAKSVISENLNGAVKRGKLTEEARLLLEEESFGLHKDLSALSKVDLVIEAAFEDLAVKKGIFAALDRICGLKTILASNTSYLDINELAKSTNRPEQVIGLHFFSPAHLMRLVEVVVAERSKPEVVITGFSVARKMKKVAVRAGVCDGFIGNRILSHYRKVADYMMIDGAHYTQIDKALEEFGFRMGPFKVSDLAGLDIGWANRKRQASNRHPEERYIRIADRVCERGWFGRKTGCGFYLYQDGNIVPNPDVDQIIRQERKLENITPRSFSDEEIVERYMTAMVVEATGVVEEGIALRPIDVDAVFLFGYGFPNFRGGPLFYADTLGATKLVKRIETFAKDDPFFWQVPTLLREMAKEQSRFADINESEAFKVRPNNDE